MKLKFSRMITEKSSNVKFNENPYSGSRDAPKAEGQSDMTKLAVAIRNYANGTTLQTNAETHIKNEERNRIM